MSCIISFGQELLLVQVSASCSTWKSIQILGGIYTLLSPNNHVGKNSYTYIGLKKAEKIIFNPLSTNPTKWANTLKQFVGKLQMSCLSVFDYFVGLVLKGLKNCNFDVIPFLSTHYNLTMDLASSFYFKDTLKAYFW